MSPPTRPLPEAKPVTMAAFTPPPRHVAIIMDGNGRWAKQRALPRSEGHRRGVEAVRRTVRAAADRGIQYLTLYSFSSENWRRPATEISYLLNLLKRFADEDVRRLHAEGIRIRVIGERETLPRELIDIINHAEGLTRDNTGLTLVIAFNYGARAEISRAVRTIVRDVSNGVMRLENIDEATISGCLDTRDIPDPDLIIRTSGEKRLSNFLLWQGAYAELVFVDCHWPEFDREALQGALAEFNRRDRRFGGLVATAT